jgi:hypothetical protein
MSPLPYPCDPADRALFERAAAWSTHASVEELTRSALAHITVREGIDFATALLYDRLLRRESVRETLASLSQDSPVPEPARDVLIGVVPGAFYKEYPFTGADGARVLVAAERRGIRAERVPFTSFGSLKDHAEILNAWLDRHDRNEIILVSLSKGGADVQFALSLPDAESRFRNVSTWINLSGILQGTALADWLLGQRLRSLFVRMFAWWRGYPFNVLHEIRRDANDCLPCPAGWPGSLRVVHVVGFPLRRHLQNPWAERAHRRLEAWGPNDGGGILLADAVRWPGTIVPLWGADHYLRTESYDVADLVLRLCPGRASDGTHSSVACASG